MMALYTILREERQPWIRNLLSSRKKPDCLTNEFLPGSLPQPSVITDIGHDQALCGQKNRDIVYCPMIL
jgi:hypothetical protein